MKNTRTVEGRTADFRVAQGTEEIFLELNRREAKFPYGQAQRNLELYEKLKLESVSQLFTCAEILESNRAAQKKETKRVFRLIKEKVKDQLPDEKPGIIIFQPTLPLDPRSLQDLISRYGQSYKHFMGAILISSDFSEGAIRFCVKLLLNDHAQQNMRDFWAVQEILRLDSNKNDSIRSS